MSITTGRRDIVWMAIGAALLVALLLLVIRFNKSQDAAAQAAFRAKRIQAVQEIRAALASASEAEKNAVMAVTDRESQDDADRARAAAALAEAKRRELGQMLDADGSQHEKDLFVQFSQAFANVQRIDEDLLALASAAEAEKSAVMAATDQESQNDADQARTATALAETKRRQLGQMLDTGGSQHDKDLFAQFSRAFTDLQRIDNDLLALAVKKTNVKAYGMAFGPAADAVNQMSDALSRIAAKSATSNDAAVLALRAETGVLRLQALLAPHIAEASDARMDELEARMAQHAKQTRKDQIGRASCRERVFGFV
jgi:hypothetical protein